MPDRVFCHECQNDWARDEHGIVCPSCSSEFTEIIESNDDPRDSHQRLGADFMNGPFTDSPRDPTAHRSIWDDIHNAPDPDEDDVERHVTQTHGPSGISYTTTTIRTGGIRPGGMQTRTTHTSGTIGGPGGGPNALFPDLLRMMETITRPPPASRPDIARSGSMGSRSRATSETNDTPPRMGGRFSYTSSATLNPRDSSTDPPEIAPMNDISTILETLFRGMPTETNPAPMGGFAHLLQHILNPANAASGDAVYSQEQLDRVISNLMDQNSGRNATAPATEAAINSLPTRKITKADLGDGGKAECNICMDDVELDDEVTVLPCTHWYHGACISAWLNQSDTCPICRKGIMPEAGEGEDRARSAQQPPRHPEPWRPRTYSTSSGIGTTRFAGSPTSGASNEEFSPGASRSSRLRAARRSMAEETARSRPSRRSTRNVSPRSGYRDIQPHRTRSGSQNSLNSNDSDNSPRHAPDSDDGRVRTRGDGSHRRRSHRSSENEGNTSTRSRRRRSGDNSGGSGQSSTPSTGFSGRVRNMFGGGS